MDGVMVLGCHPGDCHYISGNYYTENRMNTLQEFLGLIGITPERLFLNWVSASEGERFARMIKEFTERITKIGPLISDLPRHELDTRLSAAKETFSQQRMRWFVNRERELFEEGSVFGEPVNREEFNKVKVDSLMREYEKNRILLSISEQPQSVKEIAHATSMLPTQVVKNLIAMEQNGRITVSEVDGVNPKYRKLGS
jgi:predicted metal-binding protein